MVGSELGQNFHFSSIAEAKKCLKTEFFESAVLLSFDRCRNNFVGVFFRIKNAAPLFFFLLKRWVRAKNSTQTAHLGIANQTFFLKKFFFLQNLKLFGFRQMARTAELPHVFAPVFHRNCNPSTKMTQKIFLFFPILSHKNSATFQKIAKMKPQKVI